MQHNPFGARSSMSWSGGTAAIFRLSALERQRLCRLDRLPYSIRVLLENAVRAAAGSGDAATALALAGWNPRAPARDMDFYPARVLLQDFTGVPCVVDLAAVRAAVAERGGEPRSVQPVVPVDLVIDHSVQVDAFGSASAFAFNVEREYARNGERYALLRWAQEAFDGVRVVPPGTGIVHQVNLEYLAAVVTVRDAGAGPVAFPDTLVGTDSHTTMINGAGVLGWGVGGIEAEAVMLGQPYGMTVPQVVGVRLEGELPPGATATDLVLTVTELLRRHGVVEKFVEFFGPGVGRLPLPDRATIANMAPEYGATVGFFPVDERTLEYLRFTGRSPEQVDLVERYCKEQGLFREAGDPEPEFTSTLALDLGDIEPVLAGPRRPEDRLRLGEVAPDFRRSFPAAAATMDASGPGAAVVAPRTGHGAVAIAAITSCTNTSNPGVMIAAGLVARRAVARGLRVPAWVKTSLAPGSRVVTEYLRAADLLRPLEEIGFAVVGYGCTTCIGNSGPLTPAATRAARQEGAVLAAVLSGNRNFPGRINALVQANYLASPPLVVAYALAGTVDLDLNIDPLGTDRDGRPVYLRDLWPDAAEVEEVLRGSLHPEMFRRQYGRVFEGDERWRALPVPSGDLYAWDPDSTYVRRPPFCTAPAWAGQPFAGARALVFLGDSVTTDEISPAGSIAGDGDAGRHLAARGVVPADFNQYGTRRGNHEVMVRGTFANVRLRNRLVPGTEGGYTLLLPEGRRMTVFEAQQEYARRGTPLMVIAGRDYGKGSSRDWAAKGPLLLGIRAVLAESFERIHRSNLIGMGILPLEFGAGESAQTHGLSGHETFDLHWAGDLAPRKAVDVLCVDGSGTEKRLRVTARLDTPAEVECLVAGGILPATLARLTEAGGTGARRPVGSA